MATENSQPASVPWPSWSEWAHRAGVATFIAAGAWLLIVGWLANDKLPDYAAHTSYIAAVQTEILVAVGLATVCVLGAGFAQKRLLRSACFVIGGLTLVLICGAVAPIVFPIMVPSSTAG